jgi:hypothetical protein
MKVPTINVPDNGYIDTADVAKIIRYRLAVTFPATKFTVRISRYAGGSSIDIGWLDGPTVKAVDALTGAYASHGFDGSIDMQYSISSWLMPDLTAVRAHTSGTAGSGGYVSPFTTDKPHPDAVKVRFGSGYVQTTRNFTAPALASAHDASGAKGEVITNKYGNSYFAGTTYDDDKRVWMVLAETDLTNAA